MSPNQFPDSFWKRHLDKIGVGGSIFAALCCLGFPALLAVLSTIGLGFLVNDAVLLPLLAGFLILTLWGLYLGERHHGSWTPLALGAAGTAFVVASVILGSGLAGTAGIVGLAAASVINVLLRMRLARA